MPHATPPTFPGLPIRIDLKVFADVSGGDDPVEPAELIPVFHAWIRRAPAPGIGRELLIDVADYSHVHHGPGVLLVGHQAQYHYDQGGGRPGLLYSRRRDTESGANGGGDRLRRVFHRALEACRALEEDEALSGRLTFPGDELLLRVNDRLAVTSPEELTAVLTPALEPLLDELYPGTRVEVEARGGGATPPALYLRAAEAPGAASLLARLGEAPGTAPPVEIGDAGDQRAATLEPAP